ncbi:MAG: ribonuclease P protein component [Candidatus Moranbacteria bacterium]|nr:ribonuclease P protein component [Candidatus Moranbacteria bacterium]
MLKKSSRLKKKEDFERVFRHGKPLFFGDLGCRYFFHEKAFRVGFSFGKKYIALATKRNKVKRMIMGVLLEKKKIWPQGGDMVFFCFKKAKNIKRENVVYLIEEILKKIV